MNKIRAIIMGAPGSGKGTISNRIRKNFCIEHISSGDILRNNIANETEFARTIDQFVSSGSLVPDAIMNDIIKEKLQNTRESWLLDGYPRTISQARKLSEEVDINLVINLVVPFQVIIDRLKSRWIHLPSGRIYNIGFNDPKIPGLDDVTRELLIQREDDKPELVQKRLNTYSSVTNPVIDFYEKKSVLKTFEGNTSNEIWEKLYPFLSTRLSSKSWSHE